MTIVVYWINQDWQKFSNRFNRNHKLSTLIKQKFNSSQNIIQNTMLSKFFMVILISTVVSITIEVQQYQTELINCDDYEGYLNKFGKKYSEADKQARKINIFKPICEQINTNNQQFAKGQSTFKLALTNMTDMTDQEAREYLNLQPIDRNKLTDSRVSSNLEVKLSAFPTSLDYKAMGIITSIKNQGSCGSCWSFSGIGLYQSLLLKNGFSSYDLSQQAPLQCASYYAPNQRISDCSGGYFPDVLIMLGKVGSVLESSYPYAAGNFGSQKGTPHTQGICNETSRIMLGSGSATIYSKGLTSDQIKSLLSNEGPVMVGVYVDKGFQNYAGGVYSGCPTYAANYINHAVLLYGYDANGNWLIKNQWGTNWGNNGYMVLSSTFDCGMSTLLGNIKFSSINSNPSTTVPSSLLYNNAAKQFSPFYILSSLILLVVILI